MLNCTATCRGADKKPRDNKLNVPSVTGNLALRKEVSSVNNVFAGVSALTSANRMMRTAERVCQSSAVTSAFATNDKVIKAVLGE